MTTAQSSDSVTMEHHNGYHLEYFNGNQDSFYFDPDGEAYLSRQRQPPKVIQCPVKPPEALNTGFRRSSIPETRIVSSKGTVRGFRNRVKVGIATFLENDQSKSKNYQQIEQGKIVVYMTSMMIIRDTYEGCQRVRKMLQNHMVQYEERDIFMSRNNQLELAERLGQKSEIAAKISVPQVFADGVHIGGADEMERLNETGQLRVVLQHYQRVTKLTSCTTCGGYRYIPCTSCHGSKKSLHRNHFTEEFSALRCIVCDENGLIRCSECTDS